MSNMDVGPRKKDIDAGDTEPRPVPLDDRIRFLKEQGFGLASLEERLVKVGKTVETLDLHGLTTLTSQDFNFLTKHCPNIKRLNINDCTPSIQSVAEVARLSKLEVLDMNRSLAHQNGLVSEILRRVYSTGTLSVGLKAKFKEIAATITDIDLHGVRLSKEALQEVITLFPNLQKLNLSDCGLSIEHISSIIIQELVTRKAMNSPILGLIQQHISQIRRLDLQGVTLTAQDIKVISQVLPHLREISLKGCTLDSAAISELASFTELEKIEAQGNATLFTEVRLPLSQIRRLDLQGVTLTAQDIKVISQVLPHLREISLKGCTLDSAAISELTSFTELEKIEAPGNATLEKVSKRQAQILQAKIEKDEKGKLNPAQALKLALFMEVRLPQEVAKGQLIFTKKAYNLPRSLQYSAQEGGAVYLMAKHKISKIKAAGSYKKVTSCAQFILKEYATAPLTFVHGLSKRNLGAGDFKLVKDEIALTGKLADEVRQKFPNLPMGILPLHTVRDFTNLKGVPRLSMISEAFDGDVLDICKRGERLSLDNYLRLVQKIAHGVYQLHSLGYAHGDIKPDNFLFREDKQTKEIQDARLIDFGFLFRAGIDAPKSSPGKYGTTWYTAPELFGVHPFSGDFQKADVFAFGMTCYTAFFGGFPAWKNIIAEWQMLKTGQVLPETGAALQDMIRRVVEVPLLELQQKPHLTSEDKVLMLIYKTMRLDPRQRIDMATFMREIAQIADSPKNIQ